MEAIRKERIMEDDYEKLIAKAYPDQTVEKVGEFGFEGYDWSLTVAYRTLENGNYYLVSDEGCSCYFFGENATLDDIKHFTSRRALLDYLRKQPQNSDQKGLHSILVTRR